MKCVEDRYIEAVMRDVFASGRAMGALESDLRAHFADGEAAGESAQEVAARLGSPGEVAASFMEGAELRPAGFWVRSAAFLADLGLCVTLALPLLALAVLVGVVGSAEIDPGPVAIAVTICAGLTAVGMLLVYFPLFEARFGWTPGKWLLELHVIGETRGRISVGQAIVRRLSYYLEILLVDALFIPFSRTKQRAFDRVAGTRVVHDPDGDGAWWRWAACLLPWALPAAAVTLLAIFGS
jgi:uncharacterized RDD family membrane protein YckC